jgi:hypothetical protein
VNLCCDSDLSYGMNADSLQLCSNYSYWNEIAIIILIAMVGFAFFVPSTIVIVWTCLTCYRSCRNP